MIYRWQNYGQSLDGPDRVVAHGGPRPPSPLCSPPVLRVTVMYYSPPTSFPPFIPFLSPPKNHNTLQQKYTQKTRDRRDEPSTNWKAHPSSSGRSEGRQLKLGFPCSSFHLCHLSSLGKRLRVLLKNYGFVRGKKIERPRSTRLSPNPQMWGGSHHFYASAARFFHVVKMFVFQGCAGGIVRGVRGHV